MRIWAPALSSILAYSTVRSIVGNTLNLAVTGIDKFSCRVLTAQDHSYVLQRDETLRLQDVPSWKIRSQSSCKNEPYLPRLAISCGQPKLRSTASQWFSKIFAAASSLSGSFAQNWTTRGLSVVGSPSSPEDKSKLAFLTFSDVVSAKICVLLCVRHGKVDLSKNEPWR